MSLVNLADIPAMPRNFYECDMHTHSNRSDGHDSPRELIDLAVETGLRVLVLSDHDIRPPTTIEAAGQSMDPVTYAAAKGLIFIPGIEFSCDTQADDVHIVGMGCDFNSAAMAEAQQSAAASKVKGYRHLTEVLCEHGVQVTWEDILQGDGSPRKPEEVQRKHIFEEIARKGYTQTWAEAKIMVRDNPVYNIRREKIDPIQAIRIIQASGGLAILAHPYLIDEQVQFGNRPCRREEYIERLIEAGLDGIEACYTYDKTSYKGTQTKQTIEQEIRERYAHRLAIISGGSDYHHDARKGVANARELGEAGITWAYFCQNELFARFCL